MGELEEAENVRVSWVLELQGPPGAWRGTGKMPRQEESPGPVGDAHLWDEFAQSSPSTGVTHCLKDPGGAEAWVKQSVSDSCRGVTQRKAWSLCGQLQNR